MTVRKQDFIESVYVQINSMAQSIVRTRQAARYFLLVCFALACMFPMLSSARHSPRRSPRRSPRSSPKSPPKSSPTPTPNPSSSLYQGDLTFYGGARAGGHCTSVYNYPGFTTVAMNQEQYAGGKACGACVHACYTANSGSRRCFDAIVDNECPECSRGDLDLGESGSGRWPVEWSYVPTFNRVFLF